MQTLSLTLHAQLGRQRLRPPIGPTCCPLTAPLVCRRAGVGVTPLSDQVQQVLGSHSPFVVAVERCKLHTGTPRGAGAACVSTLSNHVCGWTALPCRRKGGGNVGERARLNGSCFSNGYAARRRTEGQWCARVCTHPPGQWDGCQLRQHRHLRRQRAARLEGRERAEVAEQKF
jgi:hypothetical protein